jgi:hypothetical protein
MRDEKSLLFDAAMRIVKIDISYPCGVTRQIHSMQSRAEVLALKDLLIRESGLEPDDDSNISEIDKLYSRDGRTSTVIGDPGIDQE